MQGSHTHASGKGLICTRAASTGLSYPARCALSPCAPRSRRHRPTGDPQTRHAIGGTGNGSVGWQGYQTRDTPTRPFLRGYSKPSSLYQGATLFDADDTIIVRSNDCEQSLHDVLNPLRPSLVHREAPQLTSPVLKHSQNLPPLLSQLSGASRSKSLPSASLRLSSVPPNIKNHCHRRDRQPGGMTASSSAAQRRLLPAVFAHSHELTAGGTMDCRHGSHPRDVSTTNGLEVQRSERTKMTGVPSNPLP